MGWLFVALAAITEIIGVIGLKLFTQKKNFLNTVIYASGFAGSFLFLYLAFRYLEVGVAYAVWIGIGTAGAVIVNMIFFGESKNLARIGSIALIVVGVVGLKVLS